LSLTTQVFYAAGVKHKFQNMLIRSLPFDQLKSRK